jgi:DNA-3-methyladenine glycosylase
MPKRKSKKLPRSFYSRRTLEVAPDILGKHLVYNSPSGQLSARIVEVEAYIGQDDPACHASRGLTERTRPMFGPSGFTYIYFVYGMYHCLNFVTEPEGRPAALLLRAAEPEIGLELMLKHTNKRSTDGLLSGPGKLCRAFGLTRDQNNLDLTGDTIYIEDRGTPVRSIERSGRIGLKVARDRLWRFFDADSKALSPAR